jgi:2-haloacid dehalogenase
MTASSTPRRPSVLVFDVNETLIDIDSIAPLFGQLFGDQRVLREWFGQLVMYSMTTTLSECYVDFFTLGQGVLRMLGDIYRVNITDGDLLALKAAMLAMPPHPDTAAGLTRLRDSGFRLVTLTNSPPNPDGPTPLENAGLAQLFERTLSVDSCSAFKPSPVVYRYVCQELNVAPTECMMIAAHVWDLLGAHNVGFSTALITRWGNPPLPAHGLPQPDLVVDDLHQLAERLA